MDSGHVFRRGPASPGGAARRKPWAYLIELGQGLGGRRQQLKRSGFATKREATEAMQKEIARRRSGATVDPGRLTLSGYLCEQWLPSLVDVRPSTLRSYRGHVDHHLVPLLGARRLRDLTSPEINQAYALLSTAKAEGGRGLSPATVQRVHATLRAALADAVRWGLLASSPAAGAQLPRRRHRDMNVWSAAQLRQFLTVTRKDDLHALYALVAATGMRRGEATGLRWTQVDLERARLLVDHQLVDNGYVVSSGDPKSGRSRRVLSLDPATVQLLRCVQRGQNQQREVLGFDGEAVYVFTRADGSTYHPDFVTKHFGVLVRRAGLPSIRLHDLRHTHATLGLAAGVPAKVMSDRLGHSTVLLTLDTYSHVTPAQDAAAAALIADLIHGEPDQREAPRDPHVTHEPREGSDNEEDKA